MTLKVQRHFTPVPPSSNSSNSQVWFSITEFSSSWIAIVHSTASGELSASVYQGGSSGSSRVRECAMKASCWYRVEEYLPVVSRRERVEARVGIIGAGVFSGFSLS